MPRFSPDTYALMQFQSRVRSVGVAYLLWVSLGIFGAHRFYLGRTGTAIAQLILTLTLVGLIINIVWLLVDLFVIPDLVHTCNQKLLDEIEINAERHSGAPPPPPPTSA